MISTMEDAREASRMEALIMNESDKLVINEQDKVDMQNQFTVKEKRRLHNLLDARFN